ncbi:AraC family transcriptional regulator [Anaerorhabdus sp.]|jgi:AraC-like DNA-binding protein|uniref:AraC family transcriptional regulator n=1 Tax=Anaerorhabdus sp. TaxID=1872524 RepID=UPI002FC802EA
MNYFDNVLNHYFKIKENGESTELNLLSINECGHYKTVLHSIEKNKNYPGEVLIFYVASGQGIVSFNDNYYALVPNDLIIIKTDDNFFISNNNWEIFYAFISGNNINEIIEKVCDKGNIFDYHLKSAPLSFFKKAFDNNDAITQYFLVNKLLSELFLGSVNKVNSTQDIIRNSLLYIENHYMDKIGLKDICEYVGYSEFYFSRAFKNAIGDSPYSFILKRRLQQAQLLLLTTDLIIEEIAKQCGFVNENNFYTYFSRAFSLTPNQYRKTNK